MLIPNLNHSLFQSHILVEYAKKDTKSRSNLIPFLYQRFYHHLLFVYFTKSIKETLAGIPQFNMSCIDQILKRRSIRKYSNEPVPEDVKEKILEAGRQAPSAVNAQLWHFIVVDDPILKQKLASTGRFRSFVKDCSFVVVGLYKTRNPILKRWGQVDTVIALQNMVLAAQVQGVGSCWIGDLSGGLDGLLGIPEEANVVAMVSFGIPNEDPGQKPKKDSEKIFHFNKW